MFVSHTVFDLESTHGKYCATHMYHTSTPAMDVMGRPLGAVTEGDSVTTGALGHIWGAGGSLVGGGAARREAGISSNRDLWEVGKGTGGFSGAVHSLVWTVWGLYT